ncbi:hypothetical protein [Antarctobacter heliothermus]|uniref:hypothetical protein n=1 Tax=Antarctobacter heliothermus TaxID=74033 RepID=UPI0012FE54D3|nr:hypothetical protein [Antarctobacter heliothermus]
MKKLKINLENCYGIGSFDHLFDFSKSSTFIVYAPNGTMKSSLARTLRFFADRKTDPPCDRFFPDRVPKFELILDDQLTEGNVDILVVDPEQPDYDAAHKISSFVASKELKRAYDAIYEDLEKKKTEFVRKLKRTSQSTDCENEFFDAFQNDDQQNFFDLLTVAFQALGEDTRLYKFRYNDVFDRKGNVKKFLEKKPRIPGSVH